MAFMSLKVLVFEKSKVPLIFALFLFSVLLLPIPINERSQTTFMAFVEGSIEHILRGKIWLYGFDSVFSQVLIDYLFVVSICCSFRNRIKIE